MIMADKTPATIETWDPFRELDFFRNWTSPRFFGGLREGLPAAPERWAPSMEFSETDDGYVVTVELAGANKDDVNVEVENGVLTIRGEKKSEREEENDKRRYSERTFGMFSRSLTLPSNAREDDVKAGFSDGVLKVEIAKGEQEKSKTIQIR
jgi:HSP20 family protein